MTNQFEFVVAGSFGPHLRAVLADLEIEDRPPRTRLVLASMDQPSLLSLLAAISDKGQGVDTIRRISTQRSSPINAPVHASPDGYPPAGDPPVSPKPPSKSEGAAPMMPATTIPPDRQPPAQTCVRGGQGTVHQ